MVSESEPSHKRWEFNALGLRMDRHPNAWRYPDCARFFACAQNDENTHGPSRLWLESTLIHLAELAAFETAAWHKRLYNYHSPCRSNRFADSPGYYI
jgi:hypothetical protein